MNDLKSQSVQSQQALVSSSISSQLLYSIIRCLIKHLVLYGKIITLQIIFESFWKNSNHNTTITCNHLIGKVFLLLLSTIKILTGKSVFYSIDYKNYWNRWLAASDLFPIYIYTKSINLYRFYCLWFYVWKMWFIKETEINVCFFQHFNIRQIKDKKNTMGSTKWTYYKEKNGGLPVTTLFFRKFCLSLKTSCKGLIWCTHHPDVHIRTFQKCWSFIWGCLFHVSILKGTPM